MVFQQFNLFERRTALENVMEGLIQVKKLSKAQAKEIAEAELDKANVIENLITRKCFTYICNFNHYRPP